ncbi:[benzylsuccinate synthase]-activating enzyme [Magnetospirillum sp. 15-1]|uniref:[benzylsuccinate synthase]-activating enzyme n=1 Tax=Magnetospirillum sp. 15-1 TaxID=1979370 RepID=UPI000BBC9D3F|nr:[benzylsuccinate synthase]-activating enzyme [Magnetospirillum sp. 15-1]
MKIPLITEIQRFSLQDGPGIRTTIFLKGCPLRCPWCHNPETQDTRREMFYYENRCVGCGRCVAVCSTGASTLVDTGGKSPTLVVNRDKCDRCLRCAAVCLTEARGISGQAMTVDEILREALSDKPFYKNSGGGVTLSGGDPLMYPEFVLELARRLHDEGVHLAMETSCFPKHWETMEPLVEHTDLFIVDLKCLNAKRHEEVVGWPLQPILRNLNNLFERNATVRIHIPVIPGFNDSEEDFRDYAEFLGAYADRLNGVDILNYHSYGEGKYAALGRMETYKFAGVAENPAEVVLPLVKALKDKGIPGITVGGLVGITCNR